jgi:hypothetical protein
MKLCAIPFLITREALRFVSIQLMVQLKFKLGVY